ncbi:hypothetical protein HHK36_003675 [Tetracentron sinense]|uniref:Dof zinc finger protein n=1 Tax=Tetracentron sinense TaxID=13715 RepID=A0A835DPI8_TETSI|nr:hypothetical protein HHK36_003675 [Tetracentron sinense]
MEDNRGLQQQQDRRLKLMQPPDNQQLQPQKCPRCESLNTKFCYYNNYSLSQPRYFCKTCRRYWTQGGTLRNVPVGGGSRKGKKSKTPFPSNSTTNPITSSTPAISPVASGSSIYYPGGGFLSSLAGIQSFNQFNNVGGDFGGSNLALLQGFSQQQHQQIQQQQGFQMGNGDKTIQNLFPLMDQENVVVQPNRGSNSHQDWHQSFINNTNSTGYWSSTAGPSLNPTQWPDLPGYDPPPS